jgi:hypothetical protein
MRFCAMRYAQIGDPASCPVRSAIAAAAKIIDEFPARDADD